MKTDLLGVASTPWSLQTATGTEQRPRSIEEAATQFEGLLIGQMLRSMREAAGGEGWLGIGEDQTGSPIMEFAEQQVASLLAASGGLGLAKMVVESMAGSGPASSQPVKLTDE